MSELRNVKFDKRNYMKGIIYNGNKYEKKFLINKIKNSCELRKRK
jgi:hypothetical protein